MHKQRACKICLLFFKRVQGLVLNQAAHLSSVWHLSHHVKLASASNTSLSSKDKKNLNFEEENPVLRTINISLQFKTKWGLMFHVALHTLLLIQNQECNFPNSGRHWYWWTLHACTCAHTHIHTLSLTHTHLFFCLSLSSPPPKQQKSEHVKEKRFGMILIKTLGVNSLSELREYCFDLEPILKESIVMFWNKEF